MNPTSVESIVNPRAVSKTVVVEIAKNIAMSIPAIRKARTRMGRTILAPEKEQLHRYVFDLYNSVTEYAGGVAGKSVLEIGPGDNLVTGLAFMAGGAKSYTALDRFPGPYGSDEAKSWYRLLAANWPYGEWPQTLDPNTFPHHPDVHSKGLSIESIDEDIGKYDVVCSYAVGEHVSDIHQFASLTRDALKPGGVGIHVIDFGGHQWNRFGDPFLFMKFPEPIWQMMGSARGEANRVRFDEYHRCFEQAGFSVEVPSRLFCTYDANDPWVKARADDSFLTTDATFVLRSNS